ncbi:MAG: ROK family protein [Limnohabitans sp.]
MTSANARLRPRGSNHVGMRQYNERVVLQALGLHGCLAKAELARQTGLTAQTIGLITTRLEEDGLILRDAPVRGRIGQPSVPLRLNPDGAFAIGIKVGRRSTDWLLVDFAGQVRERLSLSYAFPDAAQLLPALGENLRQLSTHLGPLAERLVGVGVAAPFVMGGRHRLLGLSDTQAQAWNSINLASEVQAMTDLPVSFARDTAAATVAELVAGRGRELRSFLYLFVDTFVGGGLVIHSHPHVGVHGNAGAVASLPWPDERHTGHTGPRRQLIHQASLWDLEERLQALGLDRMAAYDARALQGPHAEVTRQWLAQAGQALAHAVVSGTAFLDLDAVVVDGSLDRTVLDALIGQTRESLTHHNWEGLWVPSLYTGLIGSDARALGGALVPLHSHFAPDPELFLKV